MYKLFLLVTLTLFSSLSLAAGNESITHIVQRDSLVKSGNVVLTTRNIGSETFTLQIDYNVKASAFFITRDFKGTKNIDLPIDFLDPYGYQELEEQRVRDDSRAKIVHKGRYQSGLYYDCHVIHIFPKDGKNWDGIFTYCPSVPSIGFIKTEITMRKIPWIGTHTIRSVITNN